MIDFGCKKFEIDAVIKCGLALTRSELEILKFLVNNDENSYSSNDIAKELNIDLTTSQRALKNLREKKLVRRMQRNLSPGGYVFLYKIINRDEVKKQLMNIIHNWVQRVEKEISEW